MSKYDEFDLDIQTVKSGKGAESTASGALCFSIAVCTDLVTAISCIGTECGCTSTEGSCTDSTCSACHSYCGNACRR